ncbi:MAG: site-2 protease family protein [Ruminiclostridium sp.]
MLRYLLGGADALTIIMSLFAILVVLLVATPVHECAHGWMAKALGDDTAERSGRLTLNPVHHLDLLGTICMLLFGIGWGKPVPINPSRCRKVKSGKTAMALTALAGPVSNILLSLIFMIIYKVVFYTCGSVANIAYFLSALVFIIDINLFLAVFNLIPIPPFDGSRILLAFLPTKWYFGIMKYERVIQIGILMLLWSGILSLPLNIVSNWLFNGLDFITTPIDMIFTR